MKIKTFKARTGSPFKEEEAQEIGEFIYDIKERTTENILNEIKKHPNHIIYSKIEWNDKKASDKYRLQQVRNIVNHIEIEIISVSSGKKTNIPVFPTVHIEKNKPNQYVDIITVMKDKDMKSQIIDRAKVELDNWCRRYECYIELQNVVKQIRKFIDG